MTAPESLAAARMPRDPALVGLGTLLNVVRFRDVTRDLVPDAPATGPWPERPEYVRYKPETNAVVSWRVPGPDGHTRILHGKCYTAGDYPVALAKARETAAADPARAFAANDEARVLCFAFPIDQVLDGLRFATNPKKIQRTIYAHDRDLDERTWRVSDSRLAITTVRFKPEKRAVLRIDTRARHRTTGQKLPVRRWLRVTAGDGGAAPAALTERLFATFAGHAWLRTPRLVAWLPRYGATLVDDVPGIALASDTAGCAVAGRALATLHRSGPVDLPRRARADAVATASEALIAAAGLAPGITDGVAEIRDRLVDLAARLGPDEETAFVHGDFHPQQLLLREDGVAVLDFDRAHAADPAADLGNFAAHLLAEALHLGRDVACARARGEALRQGYDLVAAHPMAPERLAFWRAIGLAHLVPQAFRTLRPDWPELTTLLVDACREELA